MNFQCVHVSVCKIVVEESNWNLIFTIYRVTLLQGSRKCELNQQNLWFLNLVILFSYLDGIPLTPKFCWMWLSMRKYVCESKTYHVILCLGLIHSFFVQHKTTISVTDLTQRRPRWSKAGCKKEHEMEKQTMKQFFAAFHYQCNSVLHFILRMLSIPRFYIFICFFSFVWESKPFTQIIVW